MESNVSETNFIPSVEVDAFIKKEQLIYNYQQNMYRFIPSKLKEYNNLLIDDLSKYYKINKNIIQIINNNLTGYVLNVPSDVSNYALTIFNNNFIGFYENNSTKSLCFTNITMKNINELLKNNNFIEVSFGPLFHGNTQYHIFVHFVLMFYKAKFDILIDFMKTEYNQLSIVNHKMNKLLNFVSFLNEKKNKEMVNKFVYRKLNEYDYNKIVVNHYDDIIILDMVYDESTRFFNRSHYRNALIREIDKTNKVYKSHIKNPNLNFIFKIMDFSKQEITNIKKELITIDLCKERLKDNYQLVPIFIDKLKMIEFEIYNYNYDLQLYVHRQRIIHDYSKYLKTLYNDFKAKINEELTNDVIHTLIINKCRDKRINNFILKIIKTDTENLIYL